MMEYNLEISYDVMRRICPRLWRGILHRCVIHNITTGPNLSLPETGSFLVTGGASHVGLSASVRGIWFLPEGSKSGDIFAKADPIQIWKPRGPRAQVEDDRIRALSEYVTKYHELKHA